jgi:hypothetical protein
MNQQTEIIKLRLCSFNVNNLSASSLLIVKVMKKFEMINSLILQKIKPYSKCIYLNNNILSEYLKDLYFDIIVKDKCYPKINFLIKNIKEEHFIKF